jgi:2C-methyl-D-erythritol 2,4-cyclodiphosphate synthase
MKNKSSKRTSLYLVIGLVIVSIVMSIFIQRPKFIEYNEAISTSLNNILQFKYKKK